jgi:hypothetical protein
MSLTGRDPSLDAARVRIGRQAAYLTFKLEICPLQSRHSPASCSREPKVGSKLLSFTTGSARRSVERRGTSIPDDPPFETGQREGLGTDQLRKTIMAHAPKEV